MAVDFLHFLLNYILAGILLNYVRIKMLAKNSDSPSAKALSLATA